MFILTPIAINSSITSKQVHVCIVTTITTALIEFSNVIEKKKELKSSFHCLRAMSISPSIDVILQIPSVKMCEN